MANTENTAINELIAQVTGAGPPRPTAPAEPEPEVRRLGGPDRRPLYTALPASMPVAAPFEGPRPAPVEPPREPAGAPAPDGAGDPVFDAAATDPSAAQSWTPSMAAQIWSEGEHNVGTLRLKKPSELRIVVGKLVLPVALLLIAGVAIGALVAFHGGGAAP